MDFPVDEKLPGAYFTDIINAQLMMVKIYLEDLDTPIVFLPMVGLGQHHSGST